MAFISLILNRGTLASNLLKTMLVFAGILTIPLFSGASPLAHAARPSASAAMQPQLQTPDATQRSAPSVRPQPEERKITAYTLPPETYKKARELSKIRFRMALIGFVYGLFVLWLVLQLRFAPKYRDWAERLSSKRFVQAMIFGPLLLITLGVLTLPIDIY